jgi:hypothetical protein
MKTLNSGAITPDIYNSSTISNVLGSDGCNIGFSKTMLVFSFWCQTSGIRHYA